MIKKITYAFLIFMLTFSTSKAQEVVDVEFVQNVSQFLIQFGGFSGAKSGVDLYKVTYTTDDVNGMRDTASGLIVLPDVVGEYPLLCYQHGTVADRFSVPSSGANNAILAVAMASAGYIVSAADYLGLGEARGFHPYIHAATEASAAIDMLYAVRTHVATLNEYSLNDQLFVTGYSQGGHAAMAAHRELQMNHADDFTVTASSPMSGPYSISGIMKDFTFGDGDYSTPAYLPNLLFGLQEAYGNLYTDINDVFKAPYGDLSMQYFNENIDLFELNDSLVAQLNEDFGIATPKLMFQDALLTEIETNPNHPINIALADNDVYDWVPDAPMRLFYCEADEQVYYINSTFTDSLMNANGAMDVQSESKGLGLSHTGCATPASIATIAFFDSFNATVDVDDLNVGDIGFRIYPNPAKDLLNIEMDEFSPYQIVQIMDISGKQHLNIALDQSNTNTINTSSLANGLYLVKIISQDKTGIRKLHIQR